VLEFYNTDDAFHYVDPPYINTNQGHYQGYSETDYQRLLDTLSRTKGKFLLSSFPSEILDGYIKKYGWHTKQFSKTLSARKVIPGKSRDVRKTEVLTANYPLE
jgi:DNA adenine methylase